MFSYNCSCKSNLQKISQTNIFNIFPASVPYNTVAKILQSNCILQSKKYVPTRSLWLSRVFTDLANSHKKLFLTMTVVIKIKMDQDVIGHRQTILINRFAILTNQMTMSFIILL